MRVVIYNYNCSHACMDGDQEFDDGIQLICDLRAMQHFLL